MWSQPETPFELNGQRNAFHVELIHSTPQTPKPQVEQEAAPEPILVEKSEALAPIKLPNFVLEEEPAEVRASEEIPNEIETVEIEPVEVKSVAKVESPTKPVKKMPERVAETVPVEVPASAATVASEQAIGFEEKTPPDFSRNQPPPYPAEALRRHLEGTVMLRMLITNTGKVERVELAESSGHSILDQAALKAVKQWQGRPAQRNGKEISTTELLPIRFKL